jgi:hypothetical protein
MEGVYMRRYCYSAYHKEPRFMGEKEPLDDMSITHGLCETCLEKEFEEIARIKYEEGE